MDDSVLKQELKQLLVKECDKEDDIDWTTIQDDEVLFGQRSRVGMDSLDALQVSLALQQRYGVRIEGSREGRRILATIDSMVAHIRQTA